MKRALVIVCLAWTAGTVAAQTVYRCGPEGRSYSQQPCPEGRALQVGDARTTQEQAQAADAARRDARLADTQEQERFEAERRPPAKAIALTAPKSKDPPGKVTPRAKKGSKATARPKPPRRAVAPARDA